jgi:outer membrane protein OmpA-like peptidoglycan-associated protein
MNGTSSGPSSPGGLSGAARQPTQTVTLISPAEYRRDVARDPSGPRALSAFDGSQSKASFQVASLSFGEGTAELPRDTMANLKAVVELYRKTGGSVRILGRSASSRLDPDPRANRDANAQLADRRAETIARELVRLGIPARNIYAGAAMTSATDAAEIFIDY